MTRPAVQPDPVERVTRDVLAVLEPLRPFLANTPAVEDAVAETMERLVAALERGLTTAARASIEAPDVIPIDAIQAIKTLPHITVDRMLGLWVSLDSVIGLLEGWRQRPAQLLHIENEVVDLTIETLKDVLKRMTFGSSTIKRETLGDAFIEVRRRMALSVTTEETT